MAIYKCKMCGGELSVGEENTIIECEFCGTTQTVPTAKDENLQGLFNRANILRMKSEFDKAEQIYEKIIQADETQAEAYWGTILCKFGIEYVEDPVTFKRVPTCHRTSLDSIIADDDYKSALNYADSVQRGIYKSEAKEIDRLQKEIIALSQKEDPYDVFICYKETDGTGRRTQDSVIANDIYHQLTQEGFKVFYAAITLEDKLGSAYEPCIFAALNSAKVMLSIGTKPEYFNAVWVKNEWSRFLKIMKKDRSKVLIPCYKDMDAYELPEEFAHLQAQDMSKIGFINDIIRGIEKVLSADAPKAAQKETVVVNSNTAATAPLLQRMFMFLEDGDWKSAEEYGEKVLDIEPQNALAYLGKLMAKLHVHKQRELAYCKNLFDKENLFKKIIQFADDELKAAMNGYIKSIKDRTYNDAIQYKKLAANAADEQAIENYERAADIFKTIPDWKDATKQVKDCVYRHAMVVKNSAAKLAHEEAIEAYEKAANIFKTVQDWKDAKEQYSLCLEKAQAEREIVTAEREKAQAEREKAQAERDKKYNDYKSIFDVGVHKTREDWVKAQQGFESISGWRDADELAAKCAETIKQNDTIYLEAIRMGKKKNLKTLKRAIEMLEPLDGWRDSVQQIEEFKNCLKKLSIIFIVFIIVFLIFLYGMLFLLTWADYN